MIVVHRRSPARISAARRWTQFVEHNAHVVSAAGLPPAVTAKVADWDAFLVHGHLASDPGDFAIDRLTPAQYASLVELTYNYFAAGYEFHPPSALRVEDQARLRARFDPQSSR